MRDCRGSGDTPVCRLATDMDLPVRSRVRRFSAILWDVPIGFDSGDTVCSCPVSMMTVESAESS